MTGRRRTTDYVERHNKAVMERGRGVMLLPALTDRQAETLAEALKESRDPMDDLCRQLGCLDGRCELADIHCARETAIGAGAAQRYSLRRGIWSYWVDKLINRPKVEQWCEQHHALVFKVRLEWQPMLRRRWKPRFQIERQKRG